MQLHSDRLLIRSFCAGDVAAYANIVSDPAVTRFLGDGSPHSYQEAEQYVHSMMELDRTTGIARYAVLSNASEELLGFCGFRSLDTYTDFGWRYARRAWGTGVGTEAASLVYDYGVRILKLTNIAAQTYLENEASLRIIRRLGLTKCEQLLVNGREAIRCYQPTT